MVKHPMDPISLQEPTIQSDLMESHFLLVLILKESP
jgi:hypothetical protein